MAIEKPQIVLDFDGVLHSYTSGWQGVDEIPDLPTQGAKAFLEDALLHFRIAIFSQRSKASIGRAAMRRWLIQHMGDDISVQVDIPMEKPICLVTIDDRVIQFLGVWPTMKELSSFKSWQGR